MAVGARCWICSIACRPATGSWCWYWTICSGPTVPRCERCCSAPAAPRRQGAHRRLGPERRSGRCRMGSVRRRRLAGYADSIGRSRGRRSHPAGRCPGSRAAVTSGSVPAGNLGSVQRQLGDLDAARATQERTLAIKEAARLLDAPVDALLAKSIQGVQHSLWPRISKPRPPVPP